MDIKIEYNGEYPCLCMGRLIIYIDGVKWDFGTYCLRSTGTIERDDDWNMWATEGDLEIAQWPKEFPEDEYLRYKVIREINSEIPHGCCGGCI